MSKIKQRAAVVLTTVLLCAGGLMLYLARVSDNSVISDEVATPKVVTLESTSPLLDDSNIVTAPVSKTMDKYEHWLHDNNQEAIRSRVVNDAAFRKFLIDSVSLEKDLDRRGMLLAVLAASKHEDVRNQALTWINAGSPELRRQGFVLLQGYNPNSQEVQQAVLQTMQQETNTDVLKEAMRSLPVDVAATGDAEAIALRLKGLTAHTDSGVRGESLMQLVRWETDTTAVQVALLSGMRDTSGEVRQAALAALDVSGLRTETVKQGLLAMVQNAEESVSTRSDALLRLNAYRLTEGERERFKAARETVNQQYQNAEKSR